MDPAVIRAIRYCTQGFLPPTMQWKGMKLDAEGGALALDRSDQRGAALQRDNLVGCTVALCVPDQLSDTAIAKVVAHEESKAGFKAGGSAAKRRRARDDNYQVVYSVPVAKAGPLDNLYGARRGRRRRAAPGDMSTSAVKEWVPGRVLRMCVEVQAPQSEAAASENGGAARDMRDTP